MTGARFAAVVYWPGAADLRVAIPVWPDPRKPFNWVDTDPFQYEITRRRTFILLADDAATLEHATGIHTLPDGWAIFASGRVH